MATLLAIHAALLLGEVAGDFAVLDEVGHVPAGLSHWQTGQFSLYRVNPPLARMLATLPVLACRPATDFHRASSRPGERLDWEVGRDFAEANAPQYLKLIRIARISTVSWSLLGAILVYSWGRELYGERAGWLALILWCFEPTVLAFGHLVVPDIPCAVAAFGSTFAFWHYLRRPSWRLAALSGLLLGIALLTKFTLLVLYLAWPILWLIDRIPGRGRSEQRPGPLVQFGQALLIAWLSVNVINLGYGFRDTGRPLKDFAFVSRPLAGDDLGNERDPSIEVAGNRFRGHWLGEMLVPVPAEFLQGIDAQRKDFERGYSSYLAGRWRDHGWWYYYLYALAVKVPLGLWTLAGWSLLLTIGSPAFRSRWRDELALLIPAAAILALVSSQTGFNHHMRYVLPIFPFAIVAIGKLGTLVGPRPTVASTALAALVAWAVASSLSVYPHSMSYFNEAAGGPERGHDHLLDSNIDWGQDLLYLRRWADQHPEALPMGLAFFHFLDPKVVGIEYHLPPQGPDGVGRLCPGYYALSINYLRGMTFDAPDGYGDWRRIARRDAFTYFRGLRPIARAGYSLYIYRLTREDVDAIASGRPPAIAARGGGS